MPDRIDQTVRTIETAGKALTLAERIAAALGGGAPKKRATWLRLRAIDRRRKAATTRWRRRRTNLLAGAAADDAKADGLDPRGATCG